MAQQQVPPPSTPYGEPISIAAAKKIMAAAEAEAAKNKWGVSIAIVDSGANLLMLHRLDNAQLASVRLAEAKARTAVEFRRPTKALEDVVKDRPALIAFPGRLAVQGGLPILHQGECVGGVGVSGVKSFEDEQVAAAGLRALA